MDGAAEGKTATGSEGGMLPFGAFDCRRKVRAL
jgi:hypothetical protein